MLKPVGTESIYRAPKTSLGRIVEEYVPKVVMMMFRQCGRDDQRSEVRITASHRVDGIAHFPDSDRWIINVSIYPAAPYCMGPLESLDHINYGWICHELASIEVPYW